MGDGTATGRPSQFSFARRPLGGTTVARVLHAGLQVVGDVGPINERVEPVPLAMALSAQLVLEELHRLRDALT